LPIPRVQDGLLDEFCNNYARIDQNVATPVDHTTGLWSPSTLMVRAQRLGIQLPRARCMDHVKKQRSRARSGQLQCHVRPQPVLLW
jgi:hypothetical protein